MRPEIISFWNKQDKATKLDIILRYLEECHNDIFNNKEMRIASNFFVTGAILQEDFAEVDEQLREVLSNYKEFYGGFKTLAIFIWENNFDSGETKEDPQTGT